MFRNIFNVIKKNKTLKRLTSYIILGCLLFAGCVKEDRSFCSVSNVALSFVYFGDQDKDRFLEVSEKVDVFIYDEQGELLDDNKYTLSKTDLEIRQGIGLALTPGKYTVIFWANAMNNTVIMNAHSLKEASVCNPGFCLGGDLITNDKLYYGKCELNVPSLGSIEETVTFLSAHISLEIYVTGEGVTDTTVPVIEIDNLYPQYDFFMNKIFDPEQGTFLKATYHPVTGYDAENNRAVSRTDVLAFEQQNEIKIALKRSVDASPIAELNLAEYLAKNDIDVETKQDRNVQIQFNINRDLTVDITVPEWGGGSVTPEV